MQKASHIMSLFLIDEFVNGGQVAEASEKRKMYYLFSVESEDGLERHREACFLAVSLHIRFLSMLEAIKLFKAC